MASQIVKSLGICKIYKGGGKNIDEEIKVVFEILLEDWLLEFCFAGTSGLNLVKKSEIDIWGKGEIINKNMEMEINMDEINLD